MNINKNQLTNVFNYISFCLNRYGGIRGSYQHFGGQGGQDSGFPSPRSALGYPFPPMHQNSYSGYHLGSYAPPCSSPPKDGIYLFIYFFCSKLINCLVKNNTHEMNQN